MNSEIRQVPLQILGKEYLIACRPHEYNELMESARLLDRRMRDIRDKGKVIGTERIAVMAALNMAHELVKDSQRSDDIVVDRLRAIQEKIESVLNAEQHPLEL